MLNNQYDIEKIKFEDFPLLRHLTDEVKARIKKIGVIKTYSSKTVIFLHNALISYVYLIIKGTVHVKKDDKDGNEQIITILKKGDIFPIVFLTEDYTKATAYPTEETILLLVPVSDFRDIAITSPEFLIEYSKVLSKKIINLQSRLRDKSLYNIQEQVIRCILYLAEDHSEIIKGDIVKFNVSLTHEELAQVVGTTRETVSRILTRLKEIEAIKIKNGEWILDLNLLKSQVDR